MVQALVNDPNMPVSDKSDSFSLGALVLELLCGASVGDDGLLVRQPRHAFALTQEDWEHVEGRLLPHAPESMVALAKMLTDPEAENRPTAMEAADWLEALADEVVDTQSVSSEQLTSTLDALLVRIH